jgi:hypothetical protein
MGAMAKGLGRSLLLLAVFFATAPLWFITTYGRPDWTFEFVFAVVFGIIGLWLIEGGEHGRTSLVYRGGLLLFGGAAGIWLGGTLQGGDPGALTWLGVALVIAGAWEFGVGLARLLRQE